MIAMNKNNKNRKDLKKIKIEELDGLKISYDKEEFNKEFPHLIKEISTRKKSIKINSVDKNVEQRNEEKNRELNNLYPNELYNPGMIDFLRRCTKNEEANEILDYLMERKEITQQDYSKYKNIISQEGGLKQLIDEYGGLKRPGYYMKKYYKKETND